MENIISAVERVEQRIQQRRDREQVLDNIAHDHAEAISMWARDAGRLTGVKEGQSTWNPSLFAVAKREILAALSEAI